MNNYDQAFVIVHFILFNDPQAKKATGCTASVIYVPPPGAAAGIDILM
jgi:hypothetical protein